MKTNRSDSLYLCLVFLAAKSRKKEKQNKTWQHLQYNRSTSCEIGFRIRFVCSSCVIPVALIYCAGFQWLLRRVVGVHLINGFKICAPSGQSISNGNTSA